MTKEEEIRELVVKIVQKSTGIKNVDLGVQTLEQLLGKPGLVIQEYAEVLERLAEIIDELVAERRISEIEYTVPTTTHSKSLFLPARAELLGIKTIGWRLTRE